MDEAGATIEFPVRLAVVRSGDAWLARAGDVELRLTNLTKVFWPEAGYTKGDVITYYFNVALSLLPHVTDKPVVLKRQPDGVEGPYFYEKDAPSYTPEWVPRLNVTARTEDRVIRFATVRDVSHLLWLANVGCIELHPTHARGPEQTHPDFAFFDLDPFQPAAFDEARAVAGLVKQALDHLGLESFPKTSGGTGIHIYVPLDGTSTFEEVREFAQRLCGIVHSADRSATTFEWDIGKRAGKVFLDANMNRSLASAAAPYSLRSKWGAPVSMPFSWDELETIDPERFTIETAARVVHERGDVFVGVVEERQSLKSAARELGIGG